MHKNKAWPIGMPYFYAKNRKRFMPVGCKRNKPYSLAPWPAKASARGSSPGDTGSHIDGIWTQYLSHILWRSASPDWWLCCSRWKMLLCWFWIGACFPPLLCPLWLFVRPPLARPPDLFDSLLGSLLRAQRHIVRKVPRQNPFPRFLSPAGTLPPEWPPVPLRLQLAGGQAEDQNKSGEKD